MKIHKQGGQVIYEGKANITDSVRIDDLNKWFGENPKDYPKVVRLTENLSASDKRRKLLTVELTESEILECLDKLGFKIMPQWMVKVVRWFK